MSNIDFCRSCGSGNIKSKPDGERNKLWECLDCHTTWREIKYENQDDESQFIIDKANDGSSVIK